MRLREALALTALLAIGACKPKSIVGLHCEGGVKGTSESQGGDCLSVAAETTSSDPDLVGRATWVDDYKYPMLVRRTGKTTYSLHRDGQSVGTIEQDGNWLHVRFTSVPAESRARTDRTYHVRSDMPGPLI